MKNQGFTLIEVMIAIGIFSIVMLAQTQMFTNMIAQQRATTASFDMLQFVETADAYTRGSSTCTAALAGQAFDSTPGVESPVTYADLSGPITIGSVYGQNLKFTQVSLFSIALVPATVNQYMATLAFAADRTGQIIGPRNIRRSLRLQVQVTGGVISDCFSSSELTLAKICASILGTFNPATQICSPIP